MTKQALFLGGTKGLGLEMAKLALDEGYEVTVAGRDPRACPLVREGRAKGLLVDLEGDSVTDVSRAYDLIVWSAGAYQEGPILDQTNGRIRRICRNHLEGPMTFLLPILQENRKLARPVHLTVIASSSSYRVRRDEGLYGSVIAGKAQLARTLGAELPDLIPGSKVLLANPGGMATPFWDGRGRDVSEFMDPAAVAAVIWNEAKSQSDPFSEIHVDRQPDRSPKLQRGTRLPV